MAAMVRVAFTSAAEFPFGSDREVQHGDGCGVIHCIHLVDLLAFADPPRRRHACQCR
jgi:hypothetical protein